jgi:exopolyphosphatase / guanosine-5'-triphosphate,3'-diphosphate pyrophosphatase
MYKLSLVFLIFILQSCSTTVSNCPLETFAGLDIGSGSTKMVVATKYRCQAKLHEIHLEVSRPVAYASDLERHNSSEFSMEIMQVGEGVIQEFTSLAREHGATSILGVATAAFRKSENASELLKRWNENFDTELKIISQEEEAMLAYYYVASKVSSTDPLIVWDIGGGSQQFVSIEQGSPIIVTSSLASVSFKEMLARFLERSEIHSLKEDELRRALDFSKIQARAEIGDRLGELLSYGHKIYGLGGVHGMSLRHQLELREGQPIQVEHLERVTQHRSQLGADDITGAYAATEVSNLIMVLGIMKEFGIQSYQWLQANLSHAVLLVN